MIFQRKDYSSLCSYIQNNQIYGDCTPETYIHALKIGCRSVECKDDFPHGDFTLFDSSGLL